MKMKPIKTYIIEEHHEAFIIWNYAIVNEIIKHSGNTLLHLDEHSDMNMANLDTSLDDLGKSLKDVISFTYKELGIASFILPAIYMGIFKEIIWVRQEHKNKEPRVLDMFITSYANKGKKLLSGRLETIENELLVKENRRLLKYSYCQMKLDQLPQLTSDIILDIDLDYFSCISNPYEKYQVDIEITKREYEDFVANPYHKLNFITSKINLKQSNGYYYYSINNYKDEYPSFLKVNKKIILKRINDLIDTLQNLNINPSLICICRSRHSGFTPEDQWTFIEENLIKSLQKIFNIEVDNISNISCLKSSVA